MNKVEQKCPKRGIKPSVSVIITIISVVIAVLIVLFIIYKLYYWYIDKTISELTSDIKQSCLNFGEIKYKHVLKLPKKNGKYEKEIATALWDIGTAVSLSNCTDKIPLPEPFKGYVKVTDPKDSRMYAFIFYNEEMACFAFSGTYAKQQWYSNLKIDLVHPSALTVDQKVMVHKGYYDIYTAIRDKLHEWWSQNKSGKKALFITGHSLGGAMSTLCAFDFAQTDLSNDNLYFPTQIIHYAMSSPRVGNVSFSEKFDQMSPNSIRVYNTEDIVTSLPPAIWNGNKYQHVCSKRGSVGFTRTLNTLAENHIEAYENLPD
jgi:hypothetical protein